MSAPWLVLPFVAGMTQERGRRAMALGLLVTMAALVGYFAIAHLPPQRPAGAFLQGVFTQVRTGYNPLWIVGGMVTGTMYGLLGQRWRVARSWISAALVAGALCLEPMARGLAGMLSRHFLVWWTEIALGAVAAMYFAFLIANSGRTRETVPPPPPDRLTEAGARPVDDRHSSESSVSVPCRCISPCATWNATRQIEAVGIHTKLKLCSQEACFSYCGGGRQRASPSPPGQSDRPG
jgi:hypothetical protein